MAVPLLLRMTVITSYINSVRPAEKKIFPYFAPPIPRLMLRVSGFVAEKKEESDNHQLNTGNLELLVKPTKSKPRPITDARKVVYNALCEMSVLVSTQPAGLVLIFTHDNAAKTRFGLNGKATYGRVLLTSFLHNHHQLRKG